MKKIISLEKTKEHLDLLLTEQNIKRTKFLDTYYREEVNSQADESELYDHRERVKKIQSTSPERWAAYINYFYRIYKKDHIHTQADRNAAWSMYIELESRVSTQKFEYGEAKSAVESLSSLFSKLRLTAHREGPNCRAYFILVNDYLNSHLRPFTSKYHEKISKGEGIDPDEFKAELTIVQGKLKELKDELFEIAR